MAVTILCMVGLLFVGWVLVLKAEVDDLKKEVKRLRDAVGLLHGKVGPDLEVERGVRSWGIKSNLPK